MDKYASAAKYKVIYVYSMPYDDHAGLLKVGKTSLSSLKSKHQLPPNCEELQEVSRKRIEEQTQTANTKYDLIYCELAVRTIILEDGTERDEDFTDEDIQKVLKDSGHDAIASRKNGRDSEWFKVDIETVKAAIKAFKDGYSIIPTDGLYDDSKKIAVTNSIVLRDEQKEAVDKAFNAFARGRLMLWDCKMRFGKTIAAYELVRRLGYKRIIVVTHRPAVEDSWDTDFNKFFDSNTYKFRDKTNNSLDGYSDIIDSENDNILLDMVKCQRPFIYFASLQDLRGSKRVGGPYDKNNAVYDIDWELVIIDEAHEGVATELGLSVLKELIKEKTKVLLLTGTAYAIRDNFTEDNIYTWTYVDEQSAKQAWQENHPLERNPYEDLPVMNILTFDITDKISDSYRFVTEDSAFNFREFFRVWEGDIKKDYYPVPEDKKIGDFVHESSVIEFLDLISKQDAETNYPFCSDEYVDMFRHTFWLVPGVDEAKALTQLLRDHEFFNGFDIVNVAGDGDGESPIALQLVRDSIKEHDKTITISCGRYTTGVTVPEWTAIMMLSGSYVTSANNYMQAIFRTQSPGVINGKRKENCYVFDFAPDRALRVIGNIYRTHGINGKFVDYDKPLLGRFVNFCPIISVEGTKMHFCDVNEIIRQIKRISVDNAINKGFDDNSIYKHDAGFNLSDSDRAILRKLSSVLSPKKSTKRSTDYVLNQKGFKGEEHKKKGDKDDEGKSRSRPKKIYTEEELEKLKELAEKKKVQKALFDLLRAVSIRLPLLFYGAEGDIDEVIHLGDFVNLVDDESWAEFMPKGLTKSLFMDISKFYDEDVVVAAGLRIRKLAKAADDYPPAIRARRIVEIIGKFRNPDRETVLTPWCVVNLHMGDTIGGYNFYNEDFEKEIGEEDDPRFIEVPETTSALLLDSSAKILEINSKSGLYPLYVAYTIYTFRRAGKEKDNSPETLWKLWADIIHENIFVLCKTNMARTITRRTLIGYKDLQFNAIYISSLIEKMKDEKSFKEEITNPQIWGITGERMDFDTIIGNPPYQGENHQQVYPYFYKNAINISSNNVSLIFPTGWQQPKNGNNLQHLNCQEIKEDRQIVKINNVHNAFPGISGAEWVNTLLWKRGFDNGLGGKQRVFTNGKNPIIQRLLYKEEDIPKPEEIKRLAEKVSNYPGFVSLSSITSSRKPYGMGTDVLSEPEKYKLSSDAFSKVHNGAYAYLVYTKGGEVYYLKAEKLPHTSKALKKYKVLVGYAWGNMDEKAGLGGAFSDIIVASPNEICTETYLESGLFDDIETAKKHAKYLMTRFARALLYINKNSRHSTTAWGAIPQQTYKEDWWEGSILEIEDKLFNKYGVDSDIIDFVKTNIQERSENNIKIFMDGHLISIDVFAKI